MSPYRIPAPALQRPALAWWQRAVRCVASLEWLTDQRWFRAHVGGCWALLTEPFSLPMWVPVEAPRKVGWGGSIAGSEEYPYPLDGGAPPTELNVAGWLELLSLEHRWLVRAEAHGLSVVPLLGRAR